MKNVNQTVDLFDDSQMSAQQQELAKEAEVKWESKMYKPSIPEGKKSHSVKIRFIPNVAMEDGKLVFKLNTITRYFQYIKVDELGLTGGWDCDKGCKLTDLFFSMRKSTNEVIKDAAAQINRTKKYLSYVQIIEDTANPALVGKIMPFQYGEKVKSKLIDEGAAAFSISNAANFDLKMTMVGGFVNYDTSSFDYKNGSGPLKFLGKTASKENQNEVLEYIMSCENKLEDFKIWDKGKITEEEYNRTVAWATAKLTGVGMSYSQKSISATDVLPDDDASFFENDDVSDFLKR